MIWYWIENWFYFLVKSLQTIVIEKLDWIPLQLPSTQTFTDEFCLHVTNLAHILPGSHFGAKLRLSVQFPLRRDPIIICFDHFQVFRILNFRQNQLIFEKSGISAKSWSFFKNFFLSPHRYSMLSSMEYLFPQKCIMRFCRILTLRSLTNKE